MTTEEAMTITERRKYLRKMQSRYRIAKQQERTRLLTEMETITGLHRKSLTRLMAQSSLRRLPRRLDQGFAVAGTFGSHGTPSGILVDGRGQIGSGLAVGAEAVLALARGSGRGSQAARR